MQPLVQVIDKAAEMCGGQAALARQLGTYPANVSDWKTGKRPIPDSQVKAIAELVGIEPADLWLIAQQARNPFNLNAHALLSAILSAFVAAILAGSPIDAKADEHGKKSNQTKADSLFIVTHSRRLLRRLLGVFGFGRSPA